LEAKKLAEKKEGEEVKAFKCSHDYCCTLLDCYTSDHFFTSFLFFLEMNEQELVEPLAPRVI